MDQQNMEQRCLAGPGTYKPEGTDQESEDQREAWLQEPWDCSPLEEGRDLRDGSP